MQSLPRWMIYLGAFAVAFFLLVSRRPDALLMPQLYAEDGVIFYAEAHQFGAASLLLPRVGYLCSGMRLVALPAALLLSLSATPLLFNAVALVLRALPAVFLLTGRMEKILPKTWARVGLALWLLAMPGTGEVHASLTNIQWHLALLAAMILLLAGEDTRVGWRIFDCAVVAVSSVTGPFSILLTPLAFLRWRLSGRPRWPGVLVSLLAVGAAIQIFSLLVLAPMRGDGREKAILGASPALLSHLIGGKVFAAALLGDSHFYESINHRPGGYPWGTGIAVVVAIGGIALVGAACKGRRDLTLFVLFGTLMLVAGLAAPVGGIPGGTGAWYAMAFGREHGNRYFFLPIVAFAFALASLASGATPGTPRTLRQIAVGLALIATVGALSEWELREWRDSGFAAAAAKYDQAPAGTRMRIPAAPDPERWSFQLTK